MSLYTRKILNLDKRDYVFLRTIAKLKTTSVSQLVREAIKFSIKELWLNESKKDYE